MNYLKFAVLTAIAMLIVWVTPASAADLANGAQVFTTNCAACHAGGRNVVNAAKTLKLEDLEKNEMASVEAIVRQVTNGKAAMPAFLGRLTDAEIADVAAYVLDKAQQGW